MRKMGTNRGAENNQTLKIVKATEEKSRPVKVKAKVKIEVTKKRKPKTHCEV